MNQPKKPKKKKETPVLLTNIRCPNCSSPIIERKNKNSKGTFLGCSKFPTCRGCISLKNLVG
jgi:ssDNA-binding Zn-finger/Zn-ribbon topoisomerase 1